LFFFQTSPGWDLLPDEGGLKELTSSPGIFPLHLCRFPLVINSSQRGITFVTSLLGRVCLFFGRPRCILASSPSSVTVVIRCSSPANQSSSAQAIFEFPSVPFTTLAPSFFQLCRGDVFPRRLPLDGLSVSITILFLRDGVVFSCRPSPYHERAGDPLQRPSSVFR